MNMLFNVFMVAAALLAGLVVLAGSATLYTIRQMGRPPENSPEGFVRTGRSSPRQKVVVCLGASIVHGRVCPSFVEALSRRFPPREWAFVNAGVNGDTSLHVLRRLGPVLACEPDYVVILAGSNDVTGTLSPAAWRAYRGAKSLPGPPTIDSFRANLAEIVRQCGERSRVGVALCSLPLMGEDLESLPNRRVEDFNRVIGEVAASEGAAYLPVFEREALFLRAEQTRTGRSGRAYSGDPAESLRLGFLGGLQHYVLGRSYDDIARRRGMLLKTDFIHGNSREAEIIADCVAGWLRGGD